MTSYGPTVFMIGLVGRRRRRRRKRREEQVSSSQVKVIHHSLSPITKGSFLYSSWVQRTYGNFSVSLKTFLYSPLCSQHNVEFTHAMSKFSELLPVAISLWEAS